jgi:putative acetyltransferase
MSAPGPRQDAAPDTRTDVTFERGDPKDPRATALLNASHALMQALFPPEDNFFLAIDALCVPGIHFFIARQGARYLGCAALAERRDHAADDGADGAGTTDANSGAEAAPDGHHDPAAPYGELKSIYVDEAARGLGVAAGLMQALETTARSLNLKSLKLETGDRLTAAQRLYTRHGFETCGPFGDYTDIPSSVFMHKQLA